MLCTCYRLAIIVFNLPNTVLVNYLHQHLRIIFISFVPLHTATDDIVDAAYPLEVDW